MVKTLPIPIDEEGVLDRPHRLAWLLGIGQGIARALGVLVQPDRRVAPAVERGRFAGTMVVAAIAAIWMALAVGPRLDVSMQLEGGGPNQQQQQQASGQQQEAPIGDRELEEQTQKARTVETVKLGLGALAVPAQILLCALALYVVARYVGGKPGLRPLLALSACTALPGIVRSLVTGAVALTRAQIAPGELPLLALSGIAPPGGLLARTFTHVDPFFVWSAIIGGFGCSTAGGMSRRKALVTFAVCLFLYLALAHMGGQQHGPPAEGMMK
jgi:hypothetical protein